jgi:hypothetical protein
MILTKTAVSDRCWEKKIEGSEFESCRPLLVELFLCNWGAEQLLACFVLAGKIIDSKKVWFKYTPKMVG